MATLPSFRTWVTGEVVTAAEMNSNIRDSGNFFLSWPVFEGRQTVGQSVANGNATVGLVLDTEDVDTDNMHSTVTNPSRVTPATAGRYQHSGGVGWVANATGRKGCWWRLNGADITGSETIGPSSAAGTTVVCARAKTTFFNGTTDYLELLPYQESGSALLTSVATFEQSTVSVRMVGTV